jgi:DNA-binding NarL/FixJ family response regulator
MTDKPVRVLIADVHPVFRQGLCAVLESAADIDVVGEFADGGQAVAAVAALVPHVVVMDLHTPGGRRVDATTEIRRALPNVAVLILTMHHDDALLFAALRAGARGYLLKDASGSEIIWALRAVARGQAVFGPRVADQVIGFFAATRFRPPVPFPQLTNRGHEVLDLLARGLSNSAIAHQLTLSQKTVSNRVSDILSKLSVASRAEAVAAARDVGLGATP